MRHATPLVLVPVTLAAFLAGRATGVAAPQDGGAEADAMQAAWDALGRTGKMHELLQPFVGTWQAEASFWMSPDAEAMVSTGTMTNRWILGDKVLEQRYEGDFEGTTFEGLGLWAYSNAEETYQTLWADSMTTHLDFNTSMEVSDDGKTFTSTGVQEAGGMNLPYVDVVRIVSPDEHTLTRYVRTPDGERGPKTMEIVYTR